MNPGFGVRQTCVLPLSSYMTLGHLTNFSQSQREYECSLQWEMWELGGGMGGVTGGNTCVKPCPTTSAQAVLAAVIFLVIITADF